jgi:two-component system, cell cycle response regulator
MIKQITDGLAAHKTFDIKYIVITIACIVFASELLIMLVFRSFPQLQGTLLESILDPVLLVCISTPAMYFFLFKPFIKARDNAISAVKHLAHTDPLTKLANRRLVLDCLEVLVADNKKRGDCGVLLLIDLDDFKPINDTHGHGAGDAMLIEVAKRLESCVRADDVVGRLGGDEFVILLQRLGSDEKIARYVAQSVAYKLIKQVMMPVAYHGKTLSISASVGARLFTTESDVTKIVSHADEALYRAKEAGKGCTVFFDEPVAVTKNN